MREDRYIDNEGMGYESFADYIGELSPKSTDMNDSWLNRCTLLGEKLL